MAIAGVALGLRLNAINPADPDNALAVHADTAWTLAEITNIQLLLG